MAHIPYVILGLVMGILIAMILFILLFDRGGHDEN